jgi:glycosyltransferase involved in cell wall biosynthesis
LAAARNTGLSAATSDKIIFLDADDRLLPDAVKFGRECYDRNPDAAFVYGAFDHVEGGVRTPRFTPVESHVDLIRCNWVASIASAMFDREKVVQQGGFDETLGMCEDWDLFLRLARRHPFATHPGKVAEYVWHSANMSNDLPRLKQWIEVVRDKERDRGLDEEQQAAWEEGRGVWASFYPERPPAGRFRQALKSLSERRPLRPR